MLSIKTKSDIAEALKKWPTCNAFLKTANEEEAQFMLAEERAGKKRVQYLLRIYSRYNSERAKRERVELFGRWA